MNLLVADSGSTKTDWLLHDTTEHSTRHFQSSGLNPCLMDDSQIVSILSAEVTPQLTGITAIDALYFYGAGCRPDQTERMTKHLNDALHANVRLVASDLLGAARALCGDDEGIVAILGTGSGSAVFDGQQFTSQTPSLGFILGDEGSGAVLGRRLLGDIYKRQLPEHIIQDFELQYATSISEVIQNVYREASPNEYLAHFVPFLQAHIDDRSIQQLIVNEFHSFFVRNIVPYRRPDLAVNFVGSIATLYSPQLTEAAQACGCRVGKVIQKPAEAILQYHRERNK